MTVSATSRKAGPYSGDGATVAFAFTFKTYSTSDLQVIYTDADDAETTWVLDTDYTVSLNADQDTSPGGTVTADTAPASGTKVTILGDKAIAQATDLTNGGAYNADTLEGMVDKAVVGVQELSERVDRTMVFQASATAAPTDASSAGAFSATKVLKLVAPDGTVVYVPAASAAW